MTQEEQDFNELIGLLPPGYVKTIPLSTSTEVIFEFRGVAISMSPIYSNEALNCYMFDLAWSATDIIYGIPIKCGIDLVAQYSTPLPNLFATNTLSAEHDVATWKDLAMLVIDESVLNAE